MFALYNTFTFDLDHTALNPKFSNKNDLAVYAFFVNLYGNNELLYILYPQLLPLIFNNENDFMFSSIYNHNLDAGIFNTPFNYYYDTKLKYFADKSFDFDNILRNLPDFRIYDNYLPKKYNLLTDEMSLVSPMSQYKFVPNSIIESYIDTVRQLIRVTEKIQVYLPDDIGMNDTGILKKLVKYFDDLKLDLPSSCTFNSGNVQNVTQNTTQNKKILQQQNKTSTVKTALQQQLLGLQRRITELEMQVGSEHH